MFTCTKTKKGKRKFIVGAQRMDKDDSWVNKPSPVTSIVDAFPIAINLYNFAVWYLFCKTWTTAWHKEKYKNCGKKCL